MPTQHPHPTKKSHFLPTLQEIIETEKPPGIPKETAWIWGQDDEVGRINLLTPPHVKSVLATEQQHGIVSSLNWAMTLPQEPGFARQACQQRLEPFKDILVNDEIIHMNTQSGSQLDGFRHIAHQPSKLFYNNLTQEEIADGASTRCGIQAASRRGIVGRGVLLDFVRWAEARDLEFDPFDSYAITLDQLLQVAGWEGVEFRGGDILLVRTGWIRKYNTSLANHEHDELKRVAAEHPRAIGLESSEGMKTWLHDQYFAVVGGDQPAFEVWPPPQTPILHEYLLACWGIMIGEMLDLEDLSEKCSEVGKYSFVFMSAPLNLPGGVATLANALCVL
ncbi:hypothetical protein B0T10DRAFT_411630 [Thelonectria olida]|uniref:Cyclase n=1 Tax=Thelonectria olida TaxID=1576542 RepID=A0A9P9AKF4_9HYPO|nr:hypothetical protein B0T10DRAFT_411630 [Thelonectria olida]